MQRLADVELQLIMHGLAAQEILKLARCSRYLLHAADAPFAWKHARLCLDVNHKVSPPPVPLPQRILGWCRSMIIASHLAREPPVRIVRHAKVVVTWRSRGPNWDEDYYYAVLAMASRVPSIYELRAGFIFPSARMGLVIGLPSMQQLRVLWVYGQTNIDRYPAVTKAIVRIPHLHTLHLVASDDGSKNGNESGLGFLSQIPLLTALHIQDLKVDPSRLAHIAECSKLVELSIKWPLFDAECASLFDVDELYATFPTQQDFVIAFAGMRHLHTLHLARCGWINLVLPTLVHAPVLRQFTITPDYYTTFSHRKDIGAAPSNLALAELLDAAPLLHCIIVLRSNKVLRGNSDAEWRRCLQQKFETDSVLAASGRFTIQSD